MKRLTWKGVLVGGLVVLIAALVTGAVIWMQAAAAPSGTALNALQSDDQVQVSEDAGVIAFEALSRPSATGFIFYPGGGVDYRAYAPPLRQIAARSYLVVLLSMPLNLAFFDTNAADTVIANYPEVENWVIGGHSLGGVAAASYAARHPAIDGIAFWASYPGNDALKDTRVRALSIYGSQDGLATPGQITDSRSLLPPDTLFVEIEGGNHSQFGSYGLQRGDNPAAIAPEAQWSQIVEATVALLASVSE